MKRKKFVPEANQHQDYGSFEISTGLEDYRLAFMMNKIPGLQLERLANLQVFADGKQKPEAFSLYYSNTDHLIFYLIHGLGGAELLMKSFFLIMEGQQESTLSETFITQIGALSDVLSINRLPLEKSAKLSRAGRKKLNWVSAILTDLEYHMLELKKQSGENQVKLKTLTRRNIKKLNK